MSAWKKRQQWTLEIREGYVTAEIVITKHCDGGVVYWVDAFDRGTSLSAKPEAGHARSLTEAKRKSVEAAQALLKHMTRARGGA